MNVKMMMLLMLGSMMVMRILWGGVWVDGRGLISILAEVFFLGVGLPVVAYRLSTTLFPFVVVVLVLGFWVGVSWAD